MEKESGDTRGNLYIVSTPIGNLEDITLRALRVLKEVGLIAAEDTRHSKILLNAYNIKTPLISLHEHNEKERSALLVAKIQNGMSIAYISDAGTPCISDPGCHLVDYALECEIRVIPVPGPSALIAALSVCGFSADNFLFCGFLPAKKNKRRQFLESLGEQKRSLVFYESPARISDMLEAVRDVLGDRRIVVARELTKVFEEIKRGRISQIVGQLADVKAKGEFTVIVRPADNEPVLLTEDEIKDKLLWLRGEKSMTPRDAVAELARQTGLSRKKIYDLAVKM